MREISEHLGTENHHHAVGFSTQLHAKGKIVCDSQIVGKQDKVVTREILVPELQKVANQAAERYLASIGKDSSGQDC